MISGNTQIYRDAEEQWWHYSLCICCRHILPFAFTVYLSG